MTSKQKQAKVCFDVASALSQGSRETQEDALATDFPRDSAIGFAVLSDGMGGHAAGDVASGIVVSKIFDELRLQFGNSGVISDMPKVLRAATDAANARIGKYVRTHPESCGMGATLIVAALQGDRLNWVSVGDSPLYLFRDGSLTQLNEDHSLAPQIDFMVQSGRMDAEIGRTHPDRGCLTSVLAGNEYERIDCPEDAFALLPDDILILASDGLQFLDESRIAKLLGSQPDLGSRDIAAALMRELVELADPDQDNVSLVVVRPRFSELPQVAQHSHTVIAPEVAAGVAGAAGVKTVWARLADLLRLGGGKTKGSAGV